MMKMQISEKTVFVVDLCLEDVQSLNRGEPLRFDCNGQSFELCSNIQTSGHETPVRENLPDALKEPEKPKIQALREEAKAQGTRVEKKGDRYIIKSKSWRKSISEKDYRRIEASLDKLPRTFRAKDLRGVNKDFNSERIKAAVLVMLSRGVIQRKGKANRGIYTKAGSDTSRQKNPSKNNGSILEREALEFLVKKGEVWEDALSPEEQRAYYSLEQQGLAIKRSVGYDAQKLYAPTTKALAHLKKHREVR
jgi:hypothetical protein